MDDTSNIASTLRTRSKVAPDWTVEESLILVNEVSAVESDCGGSLASFQKWKIIVENCNALGVNRNLNQCRRKWDSLLSDYKKIKQSASKKATFNSEVFTVIERYVRDYEGGYDSDPDTESDPAVGVDPEPVLASMFQSGSKKQRSKVIPQKRSIEDTQSTKRQAKTEEIKVGECSSEPKNDILSAISRPEVSEENQEQIMAEKLRENAELIEAIVKQDSANGESNADLTRLNGDKLIACLSNLVVALDQLSKFVQ
ncbi:uncharacterized protein LOC143635184 isoform X2 [Bidens hawaiensis]|uniref:uncharacterized protein LOC143635184 isoform X2 n=1 Tax=Bidens hawaiensis TaxID=980011 RepID=UPI004049826D